LVREGGIVLGAVTRATRVRDEIRRSARSPKINN